jgi:SAM-dependent methyltransferase
MSAYSEANRAMWDERVPIHVDGEFYDLEGFVRGGSSNLPFEVDELGDVEGRSLVHLQCHIGKDTLSWARRGARVSGLDFSAPAIEAARMLAERIGVEADFVVSDLYDAPEALGHRTFDIVYTGRGALNWLPDIAAWARVVAHFLAPGGTFFITEIHPVAQVFENEGVAPGELRLTYPYWEHREPLTFAVKGSYADPDADVGDLTEHSWDHGLGEIVTALIDAGLRIDKLIEYPFLEWKVDFLVEEEPGNDRWVLPPGTPGQLPLMFSLLASKPA